MNRFDYIAYDDISIEQQAKAKEIVQSLEDLLSSIDDSRAISLALTRLEEAYMWTGKAIRDSQIERMGKFDLQEERTNS